jgi:hypothetical protein
MKRNKANRERPTGIMRRTFVSGFDYTQLADDTRERVEQAAATIRQIHTRMATDAVDLGQVLLAVREDLGPRLFTVWCAAELQLSQGTCSNLMMIASKFAGLPCLDKFEPSALYELGRARVEPAAVEEAVERATAGERISKIRALEIVERFEMAADKERTPSPRRDEVGRIKSTIRTALARWPETDREQLAGTLLKAILEVLAEFDLALSLDTDATPRRPNGKPVRFTPEDVAMSVGVPLLT